MLTLFAFILPLICVSELGIFAEGTIKEILAKLNFDLTFDEFGFLLLRVHEPIVRATVTPLYQEATKLPENKEWWRKFTAELGNGLKLKLITKKGQTGPKEIELAKNIERKVHKPLREALKAYLASEQIPINTPIAQRAKFAFLVLVDLGQKMVAKCLSLYDQHKTRRIALDWWKSFRERISDITQVSSESHLRKPLAQVCHLQSYLYAVDEKMFTNFALSKQLSEFRKSIKFGLENYEGNQEALENRKKYEVKAKENAIQSPENPIEISVYKIKRGHGYTKAYHPSLYFDKTEIHFMQKGIWLKRPGGNDKNALEYVGLRTLFNVKTRMQPEQLQEILDLWEIESKFRHGVHSHVDLNCVDFVLDLIGEIHAADGAQEFPPKQVQILEKHRSRSNAATEDEWHFEQVGQMTTVQWPPEFLEQTPWIEWNRTGLSSKLPMYNQVEKWIIGKVATFLAKRRV